MFKQAVAKGRLQSSAALISQTTDAAPLRSIRGPEDLHNPAYLEMLDAVRILRRMNTDVAFMYVMRQDGGRVCFVVDSHESDAQAMPGREYTENLRGLLPGFTGVSVDDEIISDP